MKLSRSWVCPENFPRTGFGIGVAGGVVDIVALLLARIVSWVEVEERKVRSSYQQS
jgi:hypothetical protein